MEGQIPLPGMPKQPDTGHGTPARGDGDDQVTLAWAALFDAFLLLDGLGINPETALSVLKGYYAGWPF